MHFFVWVAIAVGAVEEAPVYRTFTNTEGQTIQARIIRYDAVGDRIQIERKDTKKKDWAALSVFSTSDLEYIQEWIAADLMLNEKSLLVDIDKKTENMESDVDYTFVAPRGGSTGTWERAEDSRTDRDAICYQVRLKNSGSDDIQNLKIEYCIYLVNESGG